MASNDQDEVHRDGLATFWCVKWLFYCNVVVEIQQ